ncbi:ribonuclease H-like domain-containing protein [Tanacetum coccineum]
MHQPPGFRDPHHPNHVRLLQKSLYRLKQAPRAWFQRFAGYATRVRFSQSRCESSLFIYRQGSDIACLLIYVDDIILTASFAAMLQRFITSLYNEFSMTDFGPSHYFLGISVSRDVTLDIESKLDADGPPVSNPTLYRIVLRVHALQYPYFMRPDLSYAVQQICLCMHDPREPHQEALKRILLCVRGCTTTRRSTSSYCVFLGNNLLSCSFKIHATLSRSSAEAKYHDVANVVSETACDQVVAWNVRILHVSSRYQFADIFTKGLPYALFDDIRSSLSVRPSLALNTGDYKNKNMVAAELVHLEDEHKAIKGELALCSNHVMHRGYKEEAAKKSGQERTIQIVTKLVEV